MEFPPKPKAWARLRLLQSLPRRGRLRRSLLVHTAALSLLVTGINVPPVPLSEPTAASATSSSACPTLEEVKADRKRWIAEPTIKIIGQQAVATFRPTLPQVITGASVSERAHSAIV